MWILGVVAVLALVAAVWAFWPRQRGIVDDDVSGARRSATANVDSAATNIRSQYPIG